MSDKSYPRILHIILNTITKGNDIYSIAYYSKPEVKIFEFKTSGKGDAYAFIFPDATPGNGLHVSFHPGYGMHLKINKPHPIRSPPITDSTLGKLIERNSPEFLRSALRLPRKGVPYFLLVPRINPAGFRYWQTNGKPRAVMTDSVLDSYEIRPMKDTFFIPRDFLNLPPTGRKYAFAFIPETYETARYVPLDSSELERFVDLSEELDYSVMERLQGVFITFSVKDIGSLMESFHEIFDIIMPFFEEIEKEQLELFDLKTLKALFSGIAGRLA